MKALPGRFAFKLIVLTAIAIVAAYAFRAFATATPTPTSADKKFKFTLKIGRTDDDFVDVTSQGKFDEALCALKANKGDFKLRYKKDHQATPTPYDPDCSQVNINTDKITTSELAKNAPAEESSAYDPNAVHRVMSNSTEDIKKVLDTFKE
jgi:hypothetical protein